MERSTNPSGDQPDSSSCPKQNDEAFRAPNDTQAVCRRLNKELMNLMLSPEKSVSAFPDGQNLFKWIATIDGPKETVFEGLKYKLSLEFTNSYPYSAPIVKFVTFCYHPNVDSNGNICLDILKEKWSALYDVRSILISIQSLLGEPNNNSPLNPQAAELWDKPTLYRNKLLSYQKQT